MCMMPGEGAVCSVWCCLLSVVLSVGSLLCMMLGMQSVVHEVGGSLLCMMLRAVCCVGCFGSSLLYMMLGRQSVVCDVGEAVYCV